MRKAAVTINANGLAVSAPLLAHIAVMLEQHGSITVTNVNKGLSTAGTAAVHLGMFLQEALQAKKEGKF